MASPQRRDRRAAAGSGSGTDKINIRGASEREDSVDIPYCNKKYSVVQLMQYHYEYEISGFDSHAHYLYSTIFCKRLKTILLISRGATEWSP